LALDAAERPERLRRIRQKETPFQPKSRDGVNPFLFLGLGARKLQTS
jgi:hypothetical protein